MTYTEDQLTGWIYGTPPVRDGVYQTIYGNYAYWSNAKGWGAGRSSIQEADLAKNLGVDPNCYHTDGAKWRGLSQNPNDQPKRSGNKRKVMYVVMSQHIMDLKSSPDSTFECKKNAEDRVAYLKKIADEHQDIWIQKIRFRTPEQG